MNNIDEMPPVCHDCPYWEICEKPYVCEMLLDIEKLLADATMTQTEEIK